MQTDYAGQTADLIDPGTGEGRRVQIFVAVMGVRVAVRDYSPSSAVADYHSFRIRRFRG